ncbi:DUF4173 domain-containing protein [Candidatus Daviesbacteria bacterium]|nr:DUF4173 domain-containing protein [Candidatus Daviesbacteria bacterium]
MVKNLLLILVFVLLYNLFFYHVQPGIGIGVLVFGLNFFYFLTRNPKTKNIKLALVFSAISVIFGSMFGWRDSGVVQISNFIAVSFFLILAFYLYKTEEAFFLKIINALLIPFYSTISYLTSSLKILNSKDINTDDFKSDNFSSITKGVLITIPLVFILFLLLTNADPVFGKLANLLFKDIKERLFISLILFIFLFVASITQIKKAFTDSANTSKLALGKFYELLIISGSVTILFAAFIFVQFQYLFYKASESNLGSIGINSQTYSEYVRKGFFELLIVSVIASLIVIYILKFMHRLQIKQKNITQALSILLILETVLILLSAFQRVNLYIQTHGLTRARGFGMIFFVWLCLILIILLIEVIKKQTERNIFIAAGTVTILAMLLFNIIDVDGLIATRFKPTVNKEVDYYYLTNLSSDAYPAWKQVLNEAQIQIPIMYQIKVEDLTAEDGRKIYWLRTSLMQLSRRLQYLNEKYTSYKDWQSFRLSEFLAYQYINQHKQEFGKLQFFIEQIDTIDSKISDTTRGRIRLDRDTQPPLF